ncbi:uncharacterized protein LOC103185106 [Callorhinchus milii]|uniref:uncharacterized protein LOC103185106 n=1 Tax=Callorhinchus milii TaxID=7868 RepID=UPI001C3FB16B|nr:uncharacterized protein LOC103185106 [Callorhinchus milii]
MNKSVPVLQEVKTQEPGSVVGSRLTEDNLQIQTAKLSKRKQEHSHQADTVKKSQEFKLLTAENVELHEHLDEFKNKIDGLNKIIQFADQRLEMFHLQIMRLETKNSALIAALNKKSRKKNKATQRQDINDHRATEECQHCITAKPAKQRLLAD